MRKLFKKINRYGSGSVCLIAEHKEDIWHVYNLVTKGDLFTSITSRKVKLNLNSPGNSETIRLTLRLTIIVESVIIDLDSCLLRISGKNVTENEHIQLGQFHTIKLELNKKFVLEKKNWDTLYHKRLNMSLNSQKQADLGVLLMQNGLANIYLISPYLTLHRAKINCAIPKKRVYTAKRYLSAIEHFHEKILSSLKMHINFKYVKCLVIASPGFYRDDFKKWLKLKSNSDDFIKENFGKIIFCHCSSAYKESLTDLMGDKTIQNSIKNTKIIEENAIFNEFLKILAKDCNKAVYGLKHVEKCTKRKAIKKLLVTDELIRGSEVETRKKLALLIDRTESMNGEVHVLSVLHNSGEQLKGITGCAAILNFAVSDVSSESEN